MTCHKFFIFANISWKEMKRVLLFFVIGALFAGFSDAAVRGSDAAVRADAQTGGRSTPSARGTQSERTKSETNSRTASTSRGKTQRVASTRVTRTPAVVSRNASSIGTVSSRISRSATRQKTRGRAATTVGALTNTFGTDYNTCHDAYFACMDQFCANQDDSYRRCVCSSKLETIKSRTRALGQASNQLQDFKDLNIEAILKTPAEVNAMLTASEGESTLERTKDKSESVQKLNAISTVLANTRNKAMSTSGTLDIAGDIKQIWATTNLTAGSNIANLTGESLYNAVHAQCAELVSEQCPTKTTRDMVISAYGMYIENDCTLILSALDKEAKNANVAIRETGNEMKSARLENYNAHNSLSINDCIAGVREKITSDIACGENYVHCLDITGKYLERVTGEPIYSSSFYELEKQLSLSGDVLTNKNNIRFVTELNNKRTLASSTLETCRDVADQVWDEFLRQAITEIHQGQQARVRQVKEECMDVINKCYDEKTNQLRDYSRIEKQFLLGSQLELSEEMCKEKLTTCSNLYGGGTEGLQLLVTEMHDITTQQISQNCLTSLLEYSHKLCETPNRDTKHSYPYGCRMYAPGSEMYATNLVCMQMQNISYHHPAPENYITVNISSGYPNIGTQTVASDDQIYASMCWENRVYNYCQNTYFLLNGKCYECPMGENGQRMDCSRGLINGCAADFAGSLYQRLVSYAREYCMRPSQNNEETPVGIMADVNTAMDSIRADMASVLATECESLGGIWSAIPLDTGTHKEFYILTNANTQWGTCLDATSSTSTTSSEENSGS